MRNTHYFSYDCTCGVIDGAILSCFSSSLIRAEIHYIVLSRYLTCCCVDSLPSRAIILQLSFFSSLFDRF